MSTDWYESMNRGREKQTGRKKVAVYCRVSTDREDQANSFESQQRYFRQYIENNADWELYEVFADEGLSGTTTKKRREFNRMIVCAQRGEFDLILTKEISRFARNTLDSIHYTRELKKYGVGVLFMNDGIHTLDGDAELRLAILASIAQEESRKTSERVKWGQKRQMEKGVVFGRDMLGYDVRAGKLYINEEGAQVVQRIFRKFVEEGKGTHVIARELQEEGVPPVRRGGEWQNTVILRILRNEKYCGDLVQKKTYTPDFLSHEKKYNRGEEEFVILRDHHEPIVPRELFEAASRKLDARARTRKGGGKYSDRHPFSGKLHCGACGANYAARFKTRADGSRYEGWRCREAAAYGQPHIDIAGRSVGCIGPGIRSDDIVKILRQIIDKLSFDREKTAECVLQLIQSVTGTDPETEKQRRILEARREGLLELYLSGDISGEEFRAARSKCGEKLSAFHSSQGSSDSCRIRDGKERMAEAVREILSGPKKEDMFYRQLLDAAVIHPDGRIDVRLQELSFVWTFRAVSSGKAMPLRNINDASVPISVKSPLSSGVGME